jgi:hypothetical protein
MATRLRIVVSVALVTAAGLFALWASHPPRTSAATVRAACGVERWTVKTLGDRPSLLRARKTSIKYLTTRAAPEGLPQTRLPLERRIYRLSAAVTLVRPEDDGDLHIVLQDAAGRTMIAESPLGSCGRSATAHRQRQIAAARARVRLCPRATVTGVAFFDFRHGQTGVAPNGIELHPILDFRCSTGEVVSGSPTASTLPASPPSASTLNGKVKLLSVTSPISAGSDATTAVAVPTGTACSIVVTYKSGPSSAAGLYTQRARNGRISWTWLVGTRTTPGRWPIDVSCGASGSLHTSFLVT